MRTARFWTAAIAFTSLGPGILIATSVGNFDESGRVEGRVTYNGRPLRGGSIMFVSQDRRSEDKVVCIDETGHYDSGTEWRRDHSAPTRFRIVILPDPDRYPYDPPVTKRRRLRGTRPGPGRQPQRGARRGGVTVPHDDPALGQGLGRGMRQPDFKPIGIRPISDIDRTHLAVELGAEPARVNIDVKD